MAKSDKNILRDIFKAQGIYEHGDVPEPTEYALRIFSDMLMEKWKDAYNDGFQDGSNYE